MSERETLLTRLENALTRTMTFGLQMAKIHRADLVASIAALRSIDSEGPGEAQVGPRFTAGMFNRDTFPEGSEGPSERETLDFRKKPVVVQAMQFDGSLESADAICRWANTDEEDDPWVDYVVRDDVPGRATDMLVHSLEGAMQVIPGDWIIRGVEGEFYPCKPNIFEQTYEPAALRSIDSEGPGERDLEVDDAIRDWDTLGVAVIENGEDGEETLVGIFLDTEDAHEYVRRFAAAHPDSEGKEKAHCWWSPDDDGVWHTECGEALEFIAGGPEENSTAYCQYCGRRIAHPDSEGE